MNKSILLVNNMYVRNLRTVDDDKCGHFHRFRGETEIF